MDLALPNEDGLNISALSRCFKNVVNSYKFYWLLAILDHVEQSENPSITYDEISMRMLSLVWYPLDYYKLSFGKKDGFIFLANVISKYLIVDNSVNSPDLLTQIEQKLDPIATERIKKKVKVGLGRWVTYRFLSPFFESEVKGLRDQDVNLIIERLSNLVSDKSPVPYAIKSECIILNSRWRSYFLRNNVIIRGFVNWNLVRFLQKNNANSIGLSEKLVKPVYRDLKLAKVFWSRYLNAFNESCVYSQSPINKKNFSIDHFIPWSYMAHDQLWNLIPTSNHVNSSKSNSLPNLDIYLKAFIDLQYKAVKYHWEQGDDKLLEDYHGTLKIGNIADLTLEDFERQLSTEIKSHNRIAVNQGFSQGFIYNKL